MKAGLKNVARIARALAYVACLVLLAPGAHADEGPSDKIPTGGVLRGAFAEDHYFNNSTKPLHTEGHFVVAPSRGILWMIEKPIPFNFIITPAGVTQALGTMPLMQIPAAKMPLIANVTGLVSATLAGDWAPLEKDFTVARKSTSAHWDATVTPREGVKMPFQSLSFAGNKHVDSARALRAKGGFDKFTFSQQEISRTPPTAGETAAFDSGTIPRH